MSRVNVITIGFMLWIIIFSSVYSSVYSLLTNTKVLLKNAGWTKSAQSINRYHPPDKKGGIFGFEYTITFDYSHNITAQYGFDIPLLVKLDYPVTIEPGHIAYYNLSVYRSDTPGFFFSLIGEQLFYFNIYIKVPLVGSISFTIDSRFRFNAHEFFELGSILGYETIVENDHSFKLFSAEIMAELKINVWKEHTASLSIAFDTNVIFDVFIVLDSKILGNAKFAGTALRNSTVIVPLTFESAGKKCIGVPIREDANNDDKILANINLKYSVDRAIGVIKDIRLETNVNSASLKIDGREILHRYFGFLADKILDFLVDKINEYLRMIIIPVFIDKDISSLEKASDGNSLKTEKQCYEYPLKLQTITYVQVPQKYRIIIQNYKELFLAVGVSFMSLLFIIKIIQKITPKNPNKQL